MAGTDPAQVLHGRAGRYRILSKLASGGMGDAFRAWHVEGQRPVVVKMPRIFVPTHQDLALHLARFRREIETMKNCGHPHIVPIVDDGEHGGLPFVTMQFLPGGSLADRSKRGQPQRIKPMAPETLGFWLMQVAEALDFIHANGIVHRDVKPSNIFFDAAWGTFLGDFGVARETVGESLTATSYAVGTPEYMAPELMLKGTQANAAADQYALAVTVYEAISGRPPFQDTAEHSVVLQHALAAVPPFDTRLAIPTHVYDSVARALKKKPADRFASCSDFARAIIRNLRLANADNGVASLLCPGCHKLLKVPFTEGGKRGDCAACKAPVEIAKDFSALWLQSEAEVFKSRGGVFEAGDMDDILREGLADEDDPDEASLEGSSRPTRDAILEALRSIWETARKGLRRLPASSGLAVVAGTREALSLLRILFLLGKTDSSNKESIVGIWDFSNAAGRIEFRADESIWSVNKNHETSKRSNAWWKRLEGGKDANACYYVVFWGFGDVSKEPFVNVLRIKLNSRVAEVWVYRGTEPVAIKATRVDRP
jgi:tRNA A-37 threonylcarbamoyl transferase component Bud32